jgi:hypothetical protein
MNGDFYAILKNHRQDVPSSLYDASAHIFSPNGCPMQTLSAVSYELPDYVRGFLARGNYVEVWSRGELRYRGGPCSPLTSAYGRQR